MTTYRTMSLNLSLWFLCCKLKIFVKARLTNLFRVIIKFRRREKYMHQLYIYICMGGSRGKLNLTNLITEQSLNSELHSSHYNFYNFFFGVFSKSTRERKNCVLSARDQRYIFIQYGARVYIRFCLLGEISFVFFG